MSKNQVFIKKIDKRIKSLYVCEKRVALNGADSKEAR